MQLCNRARGCMASKLKLCIGPFLVIELVRWFELWKGQYSCLPVTCSGKYSLPTPVESYSICWDGLCML